MQLSRVWGNLGSSELELGGMVPAGQKKSPVGLPKIPPWILKSLVAATQF